MTIEIKNQNQQKKKRLRQKKLDEIQKPLWIKSNKNNFDSLTEDIYNNLNNSEFKATVDGKAYDLRNAKKFLLEITTKKSRENEARELCNNLVKSGIAAQEKSKSKSKDKRNNTLKVLNNLKSVFTGVYLHYKNVSKEKNWKKFERSIAERIKLRRSDETERKEQNINNELFKAHFTDCQSPSCMYKKLSETKDAVNEVRVDSIKKVLSKLKIIISYTPKDDAAKIINR